MDDGPPPLLEEDDEIECEVCNERVPFADYADHVTDHLAPLAHYAPFAPGTPPPVARGAHYRDVFPSVLVLLWNEGYLEGMDDYEMLLELGDMMGDVPRGFADDGDMDRVMVPVTVARPDADTRCAVCQESMSRDTDAVQLLCSHAFCRGCIREWLKLRRTCPVCVVDLATLVVDAPAPAPAT